VALATTGPSVSDSFFTANQPGIDGEEIPFRLPFGQTFPFEQADGLIGSPFDIRTR
jgi:hypothetical protein